ncbi:hypothetical protein OROHE_024529 [Orobanche hederae]
MKYSTIVLLVVFTLLVLNSDTFVKVVTAGFGCPGNEYKCNAHCKSNKFRGGYCDTLGFRCKCYG